MLVAAVLLGGCLPGGGDDEGPGTGAAAPAASDPRPPVRVCGNRSILDGGPTTAPVGAVVVRAGNNRAVDFSRPGATYWFAPGVHTLGRGKYSQIVPGNDSHFIGAPGAVLDGRNVNSYAFSGSASGVTIEYLTIERFGSWGGNNNEGVVNHNSGDGWTITRNTIRHNAGAGVMVGTGNVVTHNCLTRNQQYGFNAYSPTGPVGITMSHNEISYNNTYDWEAKLDGCGCTGAGKFWAVESATVTDNFVHHNRGVGLWADNNNRGFLFEGNHISDNDGVGLMYETSYNAVIRDNTFLRNGLVAGPDNAGFPTGAIYVSESGADPRVPTRFSTVLRIQDNLFENNWSGVVLWENADRYCGSPANTSSGQCTLVRPKVVTVDTCNPATITEEPYLDDCRWKTQNVEVHGNVFKHDPADIGAGCTHDRSCGVTAVISNYGTYPEWSPYTGDVIQQAITLEQGNRFYDNVYEGDWRFLPFETGNLVTFAEWRAKPYGQDTGSTLRRTSG